MELHVFARGDVSLAQWGIPVGYLAQPLHALRGEDAARHLDPDHLDVGLALAVHALPQPEGRESGVVLLAGLKPRCLLLKPHHLFVHERDDGFGRLGQFEAVSVDVLQGTLLARGLGTQYRLPNILLNFSQNKTRR